MTTVIASIAGAVTYGFTGKETMGSLAFVMLWFLLAGVVTYQNIEQTTAD